MGEMNRYISIAEKIETNIMVVNNSGGYPTYDIYRKQFRYRKDSLLRNYTNYEICSPETVSVPHNPVLWTKRYILRN